MTFAQRLFTIIRNFLGDHKKKLIGLALLTLVGYYIKKRMELKHLIQVVEKVLGFAAYLPLPEAPVYRPVQQIPSSEPATYGCLKAFINIEDIKARIKVRVGQCRTKRANNGIDSN